jgi:hypothetical protein
MSVTHIKYIPKQKALQITMRLFIDDLQFELNNQNNPKIEIATDREPKNIDRIYADYVSNHFNIEVNEHSKNSSFLGKEYDDDMVVFYLEVLGIQEIEQLRLENTLLLNSFPEQENIVKLNINEEQKSHILTKNRSKALINY